MISHVIKTRFLPLMLILLCCMIPNFIVSIQNISPFATVFTVLFAVLLLLYLSLLIYCGLKLRKVRKKYQKE